MHTLFRRIKENAKAALSGRWGQADAIVLLVVAISILFTLTESALTLLFDVPAFLDILNTPGFYLDDLPNTTLPSLCLSSLIWMLSAVVLIPLNLGVVRWYCGVTYGSQEDISLIFTFFESPYQVFRALWATLQVSLRSLLWAVLLFSPSFLLLGMSGNLNRQGSSPMDYTMATIGSLMGMLLFLFGGILLFICLQRYYLVPYLLCGDRKMKVSHAIRQSMQITYGYKTDLVLFHLSFFGWYLSNLLILPILYTLPYIYTSQAMMARYLMERSGVSEFCPSCQPPKEEAI